MKLNNISYRVDDHDDDDCLSIVSRCNKSSKQSIRFNDRTLYNKKFRNTFLILAQNQFFVTFYIQESAIFFHFSFAFHFNVNRASYITLKIFFLNFTILSHSFTRFVFEYTFFVWYIFSIK